VGEKRRAGLFAAFATDSAVVRSFQGRMFNKKAVATTAEAFRSASKTSIYFYILKHIAYLDQIAIF
jgi:hypothetical protein